MRAKACAEANSRTAASGAPKAYAPVHRCSPVAIRFGPAYSLIVRVCKVASPAADGRRSAGRMGGDSTATVPRGALRSTGSPTAKGVACSRSRRSDRPPSKSPGRVQGEAGRGQVLRLIRDRVQEPGVLRTKESPTPAALVVGGGLIAAEGRG